MGGRTFERKAPFATTSFKKGGMGVFSRVGLFSGDYGIYIVWREDTTYHNIAQHSIATT